MKQSIFHDIRMKLEKSEKSDKIDMKPIPFIHTIPSSFTSFRTLRTPRYIAMFRIVKPIDSPNSFRANITHKFFIKIRSHANVMEEEDASESSERQYKKYATHLERAMYNTTIQQATTKKIVKKWDNPNFVNLYLTQVYRILFTMTHTTILDKLMEGKVRARDIPQMTAQELCPEKWNTLIQNKLERDKNLFNEDDQATTDQFTCWKCKKNRCVFYELQTSSGDESTTIFISCLSCGNRWKTR